MLRLEAILDCASFHYLKSSLDQRRNASDRTPLKERVLFGLLRLLRPPSHQALAAFYSVPTYLNAFKQGIMGMPCPPHGGPMAGHACAFNGRDSRIRRGPSPMPFPKSKVEV
jgi:hypothetical protein